MSTQKAASQAQKKMEETFSAAFNLEQVQKLARENLERAHGFNEQLQEIEKAGSEQLDKAIDESARLMHEWFAYGVQLMGTWRKASFEMAERSLDMWSKN